MSSRWPLLLEDRARSHADASWRRWWQTLLPLPEQAVLLWAWVRRRFRYRGLRGYVAASLLRCLPLLLLLAVGSGGVWYYRETERARFIEAKLASLF